ncbi:reprolysin-like metallopeptidase [Neolewinella agarilytica]|nr:zinc-dependent metalloprotease family protein [Neolewinella agarilytica]
MHRLFSLLLAFCVSFSLSAQSSAFQLKTAVPAGNEFIVQASLDLNQIRTSLKKAPMEFTQAKSQTVISLPLPNGEFAEFTAWNSPMVKSDPNLGSYVLSGPWGGGRMATSPEKVSAVLRGPEGYFIIDVREDDPSTYEVIDYQDFMAVIGEVEGPLSCGFDETTMPGYGDIEIDDDHDHHHGADAGAKSLEKAGNEARELRIYDLMMTNTGEFATAQGGTAAGVLSAFNEAVSTINAIFENEIGIRMNLVEVPGLIYLDGDLDPFTNPTEGSGLLGQVIGAFNANSIAPEAYDLGHILTVRCSDVGGVVSGSACTNGKTRGVTCVSNSVVGAALRIMAHEVAHQFAVSHSWNNCPGSDGQRAGQTAFEPGSGTTIMSYAGACGDQNVGNEESYYHVGSLEQFLNYTQVTGARECATVIETDNFTPEVDFDYEDDFTIPANTPFRLEGSATDLNGDVLTYTWEQYDLGPASEVLAPRGNAPLFRSYAPTEEGFVRYFPRLDRIVNRIETRVETLPTYSREMTFRLTARDNNAQSGGVDWKQLHFLVDSSAGPFQVMEPVDPIWNVGDYQEVNWDVAKTDLAPINCKRVNIVLSLDGGQTFDLVLAEDVPNTGSTFVTVPQTAITTEALLMVEAADNIFLNVNEDFFRIDEAETAGFTLDANTRFEEVCLPDALNIPFRSGSILSYDTTINLSVESSNLPDGTLFGFTDDAIEPGESTILNVDLNNVRFTGTLEVTVLGVSGSLDTARRTILLDVTDNDYSDLEGTLPAEGTSGIVLAAEFDWTEAVNADNYDIQIATSPTFSEETIFEESFDLTDSDYLPAEFFNPNVLYFWRVRGTNVCGPGEWLDPASFRTVNSQCTTFSNDESISLPGSGRGYTKDSRIFIEQTGSISDLNIPNVTLRYNFASQITLTLVSPAGTRVVMYDKNCFSTNQINLGFDDDAPIAIACPPDDQRVFLSKEQLAAFNGEDTFGEWILEVTVAETGGSAGAIEKWSIEFCADVSSVAPERANNTATEVPPLLKNSIVKDKLSTISANYNSGDVTYTLTALPASGRLLLYGSELAVGDEFTQADINGLGLFYENTDENAEFDDFGFVVTTPDGGYLAIDYHDIIISDDAVVSNRNVSVLDAGLSIFPNPVAGDLNVRWTADVSRDLQLELFDLNGRLLQTQTVAGASRNATVNTDKLPAGIYLLRVDGAVRRVVKR